MISCDRRINIFGLESKLWMVCSEGGQKTSTPLMFGLQVVKLVRTSKYFDLPVYGELQRH